jgi:hypothetical protein
VSLSPVEDRCRSSECSFLWCWWARGHSIYDRRNPPWEFQSLQVGFSNFLRIGIKTASNQRESL